MIKLIIFDLDGVIVSTDHYHYLAWKKIADDEGIYFDETINNRLRGVSRMDSLEIILEKSTKVYSTNQKMTLANTKNNYYKDLIKNLTESDILPTVMDTLSILRQQGYLLAIGSSSKNTLAILKYIKLDNYFDYVSDGNNITRSKPYPDVFLYVTDHLNIKPSETIVVEDAISGIDAAEKGGFIPAGIKDAYDYEKTVIHLKEIKDLLKYLEIGGTTNEK